MKCRYWNDPNSLNIGGRRKIIEVSESPGILEDITLSKTNPAHTNAISSSLKTPHLQTLFLPFSIYHIRCMDMHRTALQVLA